MKRDTRAPVIRLLTVSQAAHELGLTTVDVDRLVETRELHAMSVSPHGGRRFWPADIAACARALAEPSGSTALAAEPMSVIVGESPRQLDPAIVAAVPATEARPPHRARAQRQQTPLHPRWPRYEAAVERPTSSYLAFRDAEHVTRYLRARRGIDLDPATSVHTEPARRPGVLVPA